MILVFTPQVSPRVRYIFRFMLEEICGAQIDFTDDAEVFKAWQGPRINYHHHALPGAINIIPFGILTEKGIADHQVISLKSGRLTGLFPVRSGGDLEFDPFSAAFYLVTRYEEYLPHKKDAHHRFEASESILIRDELLEMPLVDQWALQLREMIRNRYPDEILKERQFRFTSTLDVDSAFAFREKGFVRTGGAYARSVLKFDFKDIVYRTKVLSGVKKDPFDSFAIQHQIQQEFGFPVIYFVLVADYSHNNKNISHTSERFRNLILHLADHSRIGIHPGYESGKNTQLLRREIERLEQICHREITQSRQHFLRISFPDTYRALLEAGIKEDYSMGYASRCGFRAGTCTPFTFYDLDLEKETELRIFPFTYMEGTLRDYMGLEVETARRKIKLLMSRVKEVNGHFISLWHNESLGGEGRWQGWEELYRYTAELASRQ